MMPPPDRWVMTDYISEHYDIVGSHSKYGRAFNFTQRILGRWSVGSDLYPADIYDVRDVLRDSGITGFTNITIGGRVPYPYPGQETSTITWKSYVYTMENLKDYADDPAHDTATDWMNALLTGTGELWDEVYIVQVVDR